MRGEEGMGLVEVVMAMAIAVAVLLGASTTLVKGLQNASGHERQVSAYAIASAELEQARVLAKRSGFDAVALSAPHAVTAVGGLRTPDDPTAHLSAGATRFNVLRSWSDATSAKVPVAPSGEPLVVGGSTLSPATGLLAPVSDVVVDGTRARVWRFVSAVCSPGSATCTAEVRRVTVAVRLAALGGEDRKGDNDALQAKKPIYLSTVLATPRPASSPGTGNGIYVGLTLP